MQSVDLNCDLGEGFDTDALIMPLITSANIACGYHAGDASTMRSTIELALKYGVSIGAHPSFNDRTNFGRLEMQLTAGELSGILTDQLRLIRKIANECGATLRHVKPHGALYNMAARDAGMSAIIADTIHQFDRSLVMYGLSGSCMITAARKAGLATASEVFADRAYQDDGQLVPRSQNGALIEDERTSLEQVLMMIQEKKVRTVNGKMIDIEADTICIHGDGVRAVAFARNIHNSLKEKNIVLKSGR